MFLMVLSVFGSEFRFCGGVLPLFRAGHVFNVFALSHMYIGGWPVTSFYSLS